MVNFSVASRVPPASYLASWSPAQASEPVRLSVSPSPPPPPSLFGAHLVVVMRNGSSKALCLQPYLIFGHNLPEKDTKVRGMHSNSAQGATREKNSN